MAESSMDHEALLSHTGWLQGLARGLVADPGEAEDLVQETWVRALKSPPQRGDNPRGWLRAVLRSVFFQTHRGERRRRERERAAARPEGLAPSADDLLERAVLHRRLVELLTELEEPFRTALLLRYFDGLGPREIAARLGVPLDTVRSRLRRGLARMRTRLDARGNRSSCAVLLAPLLTPPAGAGASGGTAAGFGGLLVDAKLKLAAVCALAIGGVWLAPRLIGVSTPARPESVAPSIASGDPDSVGVPASAPAERGNNVRATVTADPPVSEPDPAPPQEALAKVPLRGIVLDGSARPVAAAGLVLEAYEPAPGEERIEFESGSDGRFELSVPPRAGVLRSNEGRLATILAGVFQPEADVEPVVVVAPAVPLLGRVQDLDGEPLNDARVELHLPGGFEHRFAHPLDSSSPREFRARTGADGGFDLGLVPALRGARIAAECPGYTAQQRDLPPAGDRAMVITLERTSFDYTDLLGQVVDVRGIPVPGARVAAGEQVFLTDPGGYFRIEAELARATDTLTAVHAGFLPARESAHVTGEGAVWPSLVVLRLGGPAGELAGRVVDGEGEPLPDARVWLADPTFFGLERGQPTQVENLLAGMPSKEDLEAAGQSSRLPSSLWNWTTTDSEGRFVLGGLLERDYGLRVMDMDTTLFADAGPFPANGPPVELVLPVHRETRRLRGSVLAGDGRGVPDAEVLVVCRAFTTEYGEGTTTSWDVLGEETRTDENGAFTLERAPLSAMKLHVSGDDFRSVNYVPGPQEDPEAIVIRVDYLPDDGRFAHVRIELADPAWADAFELLDAEGEPATIVTVRGGWRSTSSRGEIVDGSSIVYAVRPGDYSLVLYRGETEIQRQRAVLVVGDVTTLRF